MMLFAEALNTDSSHRGTIVFLPGGGLSGWSWRPVAERLPDYRCLLVDLPEHGRSAGVGPFTMQFAAAEVRKVIVERAGGKAHVVGLSLGAQVAIQLLAASSEIVETAFVTGCVVRPIPGLGNRTLLELMFKLYAPFQNTPWLVRANRRSAGVPKAYEQDFAGDTRLLSPAMLARVVSANQAFRIPPSLCGIATPTLVAVGGRELWLVKRSAADLVSVLAHARAYEVIGRQHGWPIDDPQLCADAIQAFLHGAPLPEQFRPMIARA